MSIGCTAYYLLTDQLGSTSITTDDNVNNGDGADARELLYTAWGEERYRSGSTPTKYTYTGQYSNVADFGLMYYNARWYDPTIARFAQADTIVPAGVQGYDRYAYTANNPIRYIDPTGHAICPYEDCNIVVHPTSGQMQLRGNLHNAAQALARELGRRNDLEAMESIISTGASAYRTYDRLLPELTKIFNGVSRSGPGTLWAAKGTGCAGVGIEPHACQTATDYFGDTGFHPDFQDGHNQLFHLWGYIAETAVPGNSLAGGWGIFEGTGANVFHEIIQSAVHYDGGWGTSWQDFELSGQGMYIGSLITTQTIAPSQLAETIVNVVGSQGPGSGGEFSFWNSTFGPLAGQ